MSEQGARSIQPEDTVAKTRVLITQGGEICQIWPLDYLRNALHHIADQYSDAMPYEIAKAHFEARAILLKKQVAVHEEMELEYLYGGAWRVITYEKER